MSDRNEFVVYLSSTLVDLKKERDIAIAAIAESGMVKQSFRADEQGVLLTCTQDVQAADLYIGIIGLRYGYQPPLEENNPDLKSITELEYDACIRNGKPGIPRLMFLKKTEAGIPEEFIDALCNKQTADRIENFRKRASKEQTAYEFSDIPDLKAELRVRIREKAYEYHQRTVLNQPILIGSKLRREHLLPVSIACVPGVDDNYLKSIPEADNRFTTFELSPDDVHYSHNLDQGIKSAQISLLLLTPSALSRYSMPSSVEKLQLALRILTRRTGFAGIICEGIYPAQFPDWFSDANVMHYETGDFGSKTKVTLENLYHQLQIKIQTLTTESRLQLPYLVIAPTQSEANALLNQSSNLLDDFDDEEIIERRRRELNGIADLMRNKIKGWPASIYDVNEARRNWHCFGTNGKSASELINSAVERINESVAGSYEQSILKGARVIARPYEFDEFLQDRYGSKMLIQTLCDRGCLIIIDELALLHPLLRSAAHQLLTSNKSAVASICACDPVYAPTNKLLSDLSFLRVGSMIDRYKFHLDPRCELILNSTERVERWLSLVIPEMIMMTDANKSDPNLVAKANRLLI